MYYLSRAIELLNTPIQTNPTDEPTDRPMPFSIKSAEQIEAERRATEEVDKLPKNAFLRNLILGVKEAGGDVAGLVSRFIGERGAADIINRQMEAIEQRAGQLDQSSYAPDWLNRSFRGAIRSITGMLPAGMAGGPYGAMMYGVATRGSQAITEAQQAGLEGAARYEYVAKAAAIEGMITGLFQAIGKGGLEAAVAAKDLVWKGFRDAAKQYGRVTLEELPEEIIIEVLDNINQRIQKVHPDGLNKEIVQKKEFWGEMGRIVRDTAAQTLIASGLGVGGRQALAGRPEKIKPQAKPTEQFIQPTKNVIPEPIPIEIGPGPISPEPGPGPISPEPGPGPISPQSGPRPKPGRGPEPGPETQPGLGPEPGPQPQEGGAAVVAKTKPMPTDAEIQDWVSRNPEQAAQIAASNSTRKSFLDAGLPVYNKNIRQKFVQVVKQLLKWQGGRPTAIPAPQPETIPSLPAPTTETTTQPQGAREQYINELRNKSWDELKKLARDLGVKIKGSNTSLIESIADAYFEKQEPSKRIIPLKKRTEPQPESKPTIEKTVSNIPTTEEELNKELDEIVGEVPEEEYTPPSKAETNAPLLDEESLELTPEERVTNEIYANARGEALGKVGEVNAAVLFVSPLEFKEFVQKLANAGFTVTETTPPGEKSKGTKTKPRDRSFVWRAPNGDLIRVTNVGKTYAEVQSKYLESKNIKPENVATEDTAALNELSLAERDLKKTELEVQRLMDKRNELEGELEGGGPARRRRAERKIDEINERLDELNDQYFRQQEEIKNIKDRLKKKESKVEPAAETPTAQRLREEHDAMQEVVGIVPRAAQPKTTSKTKPAIKPWQTENQEAERRLSKSHGYHTPPLLERIKKSIATIYHKMTRVWEHLPTTPQYATARELLRLSRTISNKVTDDVNRNLSAIVSPLNEEDTDLFERFLIMKNLQEEVRGGGPLRFGFKSMDEINQYVNKLTYLVNKNPRVAKAINDRQKIVKELVDELVEYEILPEDLNREWYYHQQVLDYLEAERIFGSRTLHTVKRSAQRRRFKGITELPEKFDYNTSYVEAEFTWMTELRFELEKEKIRQQIQSKYDVKQSLKKEAFKRNHINLIGKHNYEMSLYLRGVINSYLQAGDRVPPDLYEKLDKIDPLDIYRRAIGKSYYKIREEVLADRLEYKNRRGKWIVRPLRKDPADMLDDNFFELLSWIAETQDPDIEARKEACNIFKLIQERDQYLRDKLGGKYATWETLVHESENLTTWQPTPGNVFYRAHTIPEKVASLLSERIIKSYNLKKEDLRDIIALGGPREQWVIPKELAEQLDALVVNENNGPVGRMLEDVHKAWKSWILGGPKRVLGFQLRNITGDLDPVVAAAPGALRYLSKSALELLKYHSGQYLALSPELEKARDYGVISSSMSAQEISDLEDIDLLKKMVKTNQGVINTLFNCASKYVKTVKNWGDYRENLLRYATFLYYREQLKSGKLNNYGASIKEDVDEVAQNLGIDAAAAKLSRELLGDYQNLTVFGDYMRKRVAPFWAWTEINMRRFPNIIYNAVRSGHEQGGRAGAVMAGSIILRTHALYALFYVFNNLFFRDEEKNLTDDEQASPHLIVGRNEDGSAIILRNVGALGDLYEWFGLQDFLAMFPEYRNGQVGAMDILKQMLKAPINKAVSSVRPDIKGVIEVISGQSFYPDAFNPRTRPRDEILAGVWGVEDEWRFVKGLVIRDGTRARPHYMQRLIGVSDPRRNALYSIYDLREKYLKKEGKDVPPFRGVSAFNVMREAAMADDYGAFKQARRAYLRKGRNDETFVRSLKNIDPVSQQLSRGDEAKFILEFLTAEQRKKLDMARAYAAELQERLLRWWQQAAEEERPKD